MSQVMSSKSSESSTNSVKVNRGSSQSVKNWLLQILYTDWGQVIMDHWRAVVFTVSFFTLAAVGYGIYGQFQQKNIESEQQKVFVFLKDWTTQDKTSIDWQKMKTFFESLNYPQTGIPVIVELLKRTENLEKSQELPAQEFFKYLAARCKQNDFCFYYAQLKYATLSEDLGKLDEAEMALKGLIATPWKNEEQIYVDLTRIAFLKKSKSDVKAYGDYFLKQFPNSNQVGLVNFFIKEIQK